MTELDVEGLKQRIRRYGQDSLEWYGVAAADMDAIIAALEDRDRLRAEIRTLLVLAPPIDPDNADESGLVVAFLHHRDGRPWHTPENYPAIRAALEGRDG